MDDKVFSDRRYRPSRRARARFRPRWRSFAVGRLENRLALSITALASFAPDDGNVPGDVDSNAPRGGLVLDGSGDLFGTLPQGGTHQDGSVVELAAGADAITTVASFDGANGKYPNGGLVIDGNGNLYGAAAMGGANGDGTVFEIAAGSGTITTLASFNGTDGAAPNGLVADSSGNLYGTTRGGGSDNAGVVFEVVAGSGAITPLASVDGTDGMTPGSDLVVDSDGNLYGTTANEGANNFGNVFEVAKGTGTISVLASFDGNNAFASGSLAIDNAGNLFGASNNSASGGNVFELAKGSGTISIVGSLASNPVGNLVVDNSGNVYGATAANRSGIDRIYPGVIFEIAQGSGHVTTLDTFGTAVGNGAAGSGVNGGLAIDNHGNLYGTTADGGASGDGTIFEYSALPLSARAVGVGTIAATEGAALTGTLATFRDPNGVGAAADYSATIDWGDSTTLAQGTISEPDANGVFTISGSHPYSEERAMPETLSVVVHRANSPDATATDSVNVADAPLTGHGVGFVYQRNVDGAVAFFSDADTADAAGDYAATIDWGDGQTSAAAIALNNVSGTPIGPGQFVVNGQHAYDGANRHDITITAAHGTAEPLVIHSSQVLNPNNLIASGVGTLSATEGVSLTATLATFTDPVGAQPPGDYSATVNWGDGSTTTGTVSGASGDFQVAGSHVYTKAGGETITVVVSDAGGAEATIASAATVATAPGTPHQQYVMAVYQDVLDRPPDANGLAYWTHKLDSGTPRGSVAESIGKSAEYYQNLVIKPDYLKIIGRAADGDGLSFWTKKMESGATDQQLAAELAASDEVYAKAGGTNLAWVESVYKLLLNRTAETGGVTYWAGRLAAGVSRGAVAQGIVNSQENNTQLINDDYFHYLGRAADANGLAYWLAKFDQGETNEDVIVGFTGSDEYYDMHTG